MGVLTKPEFGFLFLLLYSWRRRCGSLLRGGGNPVRHGLWVAVREGERTESNLVLAVHGVIVVLEVLALLPVMFKYHYRFAKA